MLATTVRGGIGCRRSRRRAGAMAGTPAILAARAGSQGQKTAKTGACGASIPRQFAIFPQSCDRHANCSGVNVCIHIIISVSVWSDGETEAGIFDRKMTGRKMIGGAVRGSRIEHPKEVSLLGSYCRCTGFILASSCPEKPLNPPRKREENVSEEIEKEKTPAIDKNAKLRPARYPTISCPRSAWARTGRPLRGPVTELPAWQHVTLTRPQSGRSVRYDAERRNEGRNQRVQALLRHLPT